MSNPITNGLARIDRALGRAAVRLAESVGHPHIRDEQKTGQVDVSEKLSPVPGLSGTCPCGESFHFMSLEREIECPECGRRIKLDVQAIVIEGEVA